MKANSQHNQRRRSSARRFWTKILTTTTLIGAVFFFWSRRSDLPKPARLTVTEQLEIAASLKLPAFQPPRNIALAKFGQKLFFDARLSSNGLVSCATCHEPQRSFTDGKQFATGVGPTTMNTPTLINVFANQWFFHNGRADSLAMQALGPTENPHEHGFTRVEVLEVLRRFYRKDYEDIFGPLPDDQVEASLPSAPQHFVSDVVAAYALATLGDKNALKALLAEAQSNNEQPIRALQRQAAGATGATAPTFFDRLDAAKQDRINRVFANFGLALAEFQKTIRTEPSPFDRFADAFVRNEGGARDSFVDGFGAREYEGFMLFTGPGRCTLCHQGPYFTDQQFHNIGLMALENSPLDLGRSQGILAVKNNPFNCLGRYLPQPVPSEGCHELTYIETENSELVGAFKTPTLRNLKDSAPYGHDGRFANLQSILQHYNHLAVPPAVGHTEESLKPLELRTEEIEHLEAFLNSLNAPVQFGL